MRICLNIPFTASARSIILQFLCSFSSFACYIVDITTLKLNGLFFLLRCTSSSSLPFLQPTRKAQHPIYPAGGATT